MLCRYFYHQNNKQRIYEQSVIFELNQCLLQLNDRIFFFVSVVLLPIGTTNCRFRLGLASSIVHAMLIATVEAYKPVRI